jgi:hypothetical protein
MLIAGRAFDGASVYYNTERNLRSVAGNASWFTEFRPRNFIGMEFIFRLLRFFFTHNICCHVGGTLATYLAVYQTSYQVVTILIVMKGIPILNYLFQKREELVEIFYLEEFRFALQEFMPTRMFVSAMSGVVF